MPVVVLLEVSAVFGGGLGHVAGCGAGVGACAAPFAQPCNPYAYK